MYSIVNLSAMIIEFRFCKDDHDDFNHQNNDIDNHNDADNDGVDVESFAGTVTA